LGREAVLIRRIQRTFYGGTDLETAEKEVQDTSCWGSGGVPQLKKSPKIGGYRGLIKTISAFLLE
jgi:hypothetical protein